MTKKTTSRPRSVKKVKEVKSIREREFSVIYFATYMGTQKNMRLSPGIGKLVPGKSFEVTEKMANCLRRDSNFKVEEKRVYATG